MRYDEARAAFDGRPHWGKHHWERARDLRSRYAEWDTFQATREAFDPGGLFCNAHLREVLVGGK